MAIFKKLDQEDDMESFSNLDTAEDVEPPLPTIDKEDGVGLTENTCGKNDTAPIDSTEHSYRAEIMAQMSLAFPVCCTFVMRKSVDIVSVMFVGRLGPHYLSAAGIAAVTSNVSGNSMIVGLAGALSTICSQAYGSKDMVSFSLAPQRAVLILAVVVCAPISVLWWYSAPVMVALGQVIIMNALSVLDEIY